MTVNILSNTNSFAQYTVMTLHCNENFEKCDTVSIEDFNAMGKLLYKLKWGEQKSSIEYIYNEKNILVEKRHRNHDGTRTKSNFIYSDSLGSWHTDSLIDSNGKPLYTFKRTPSTKPNSYIIEWFYKRDPNPSTRQIIQYDENEKETSNSTCYSADNCVTYVYFYNDGRKIRSELWAMEGPNTQPVLKETEEFVYGNEIHQQPSAIIRFLEPDHTAIARFKYVLLDQPIHKK
ncbi:MAG: hypothetical protein IPO63_04915 [Bacteroidetes bacterium]|nr:hypothetical protein [Bacteroidota bacterium]